MRKTLKTLQPEALTFLSRLRRCSHLRRSDATQFRVRFQQLTGPLMAKFAEAYAFLSSKHTGLALNEVGVPSPSRITSIERFHHEMKTRTGAIVSHALSARRPTIPSEARMREHACIRQSKRRSSGANACPPAADEPDPCQILNDGTAPPADTWMYIYQAPTGVHPDAAKPHRTKTQVLNAPKITL